MKKIVLSMVGSLLISVCAVYAQQQSDTTGSASGRDKWSGQESDRTHRQHDQRSTQDNKWQQQGDRTQEQGAYANEGMVIIEKSELPSSLKKTLQKEKYSGWENGTIYHNTKTDEYVIAPKAYRFDKSGKEMEIGDNAPGYGRSSRYGDQSMQRDRSGYQSSDQSTNNPSSGYSNQSDRTGNNSQSSGQSDNSSGYSNQSSGQSDNNSGQSDNTNQTSQSQSGTSRSGQSSQDASSGYRNGQDSQTGAGTQTQPGQSGREQSSSQNDQ